MTLLSDSEVKQVSDAIEAVEKSTDAELVTVLAGQADDYHYIPTLWAALVAIVSPAIVLMTPFWLEIAELLIVQVTIFLVLAVVLRIPAILRLIIPREVKRWRAANLARRQFLENNLHHTEGETGILIFVSETERYVEIIADRGISKHVSNDRFEQIVEKFTHQVRAGKTLDGFLEAVESCGEIMIEHVPATHERNELPNHMILL